MNPKSNAFLLLMLTALIGLVGLVLVLWLLQAWRRGLRRGKPKGRRGAGEDPWQTAGQRLQLDDVERDERS